MWYHSISKSSKCASRVFWTRDFDFVVCSCHLVMAVFYVGKDLRKC